MKPFQLRVERAIDARKHKDLVKLQISSSGERWQITTVKTLMSRMRLHHINPGDQIYTHKANLRALRNHCRRTELCRVPPGKCTGVDELYA